MNIIEKVKEIHNMIMKHGQNETIDLVDLPQVGELWEVTHSPEMVGTIPKI